MDPALAFRSRRGGNVGITCSEELLLAQLRLLPRRVAEHHIEPARPAGLWVLRHSLTHPEHLGELQVPVEEGELRGDPLDLMPQRLGDGVGAFQESADGVGSDAVGSLPLGQEERGAPRVGGELGLPVGVACHQLAKVLLLRGEGLGGVVRGLGETPCGLVQLPGPLRRRLLQRELHRPLLQAPSLLAVAPPQSPAGLLVFEGVGLLVRGVGDAACEHGRGHPKQAVASPYVGV
ncbi:hypothetical protein A7Q09_05365 [Methylacidiphilum sp. Yel]|nr:hypothetical protein A7Q09_05365 [Methylacidiphilum sp. Yel]